MDISITSGHSHLLVSVTRRFLWHRGHLLLHALHPGAPTHFADLAKAYEVLEPELQELQQMAFFFETLAPCPKVA